MIRDGGGQGCGVVGVGVLGVNVWGGRGLGMVVV